MIYRSIEINCIGWFFLGGYIWNTHTWR